MASFALYKDEPLKIRVKNVRISHPHVYEPYEGKSDDDDNGATSGKYCVTAIIDQKGEHKDAVVQLQKMMVEAATGKWGKDNGPAIYDGLKSDGKILLRNGNAKIKGQNKEADDAHRDHLVFTANNAAKPSVFDRYLVDGKPAPLTKADGKPYAGCYGNVIISVWAQDNKWGRRINAELNGVQFWGDGERFGSGGQASADTEFEFVEPDEYDAGALEEEELDEAFV